jgi:hypothetical protein
VSRVCFFLVSQVFLHNLAEMNPTIINDEVVSNYKKLAHGDMLSIGDRKFRFEYSESYPFLGTSVSGSC